MGVFWYRGALAPGSPMFIGRKRELSRIAQLCGGEVESYIIVLGARQSGKTSLLYRLGACLGDRAQVVPVNLQGLPEAKPPEVFRFIAHELALELDREDHTTDSIHNAPTLKQMLCDLSPRGTIVITIDEIGTVSSSAAHSLASGLRYFHQERLRDYNQALRRYVFVLAGGIELYDLAASRVSTLYNISDKLYLGDLSRAESKILLGRGFEKLGIEQSAIESLCDRIYHFACGHPYFTQRLGGYVEDIWEERGRIPTSGELEEATWELARDDTNIVSLVNGLKKQNLWDEARRLARGDHIPFTHIESVPSRLELVGLIRDEDGHCVVRNPIYERALAQIELQTSRELQPRDEYTLDSKYLAEIRNGQPLSTFYHGGMKMENTRFLSSPDNRAVARDISLRAVNKFAPLDTRMSERLIDYVLDIIAGGDCLTLEARAKELGFSSAGLDLALLVVVPTVVQLLANLLVRLGEDSFEAVKARGREEKAKALLFSVELVDRAELRQALTKYFSTSELRDLCFDLGVDYESLPSESKKDLAREIVAYFKRHGRTSELVEAVKRLRPNICKGNVFTVTTRALSIAKDMPSRPIVIILPDGQRSLIESKYAGDGDAIEELVNSISTALQDYFTG